MSSRPPLMQPSTLVDLNFWRPQLIQTSTHADLNSILTLQPVFMVHKHTHTHTDGDRARRTPRPGCVASPRIGLQQVWQYGEATVGGGRAGPFAGHACDTVGCQVPGDVCHRQVRGDFCPRQVRSGILKKTSTTSGVFKIPHPLCFQPPNTPHPLVAQFYFLKLGI